MGGACTDSGGRSEFIKGGECGQAAAAGAALAVAAAGAALGAAAAGVALAVAAAGAAPVVAAAGLEVAAAGAARAASAGVAGGYGTLGASSAVCVVVFSLGDAKKKYASEDNPNARTTAMPVMSFRPDPKLRLLDKSVR